MSNFTFFLSIFVFVCIILWFRIKQFKIETTIKVIDGKLSRSLMFSGLEGVDPVHVDAQFVHKKNGYPDSLITFAIENEIKKGYDFFHTLCKEDTTLIHKHKHSHSNELFYCVNGEIIVTIYEEDCETIKEEKTLKKHDSFYVKKGVIHSIIMKKNTECITIAKPQLITRLGAFYEKLTSKSRKAE